MTKKLWFLNLFLLGSAALIDQVSKALLLQSEGVVWVYQNTLFELSLQTSLNSRFAFSIPAPTQIIFLVVSLVFILVLGFWITLLINKKKGSYWIALVLGGAIGNLIDRFLAGGVIDWIEIQISTWSWSSFNFADIFIFIGIFGWFLSSLKKEPTKQLSELS